MGIRMDSVIALMAMTLLSAGCSSSDNGKTGDVGDTRSQDTTGGGDIEGAQETTGEAQDMVASDTDAGDKVDLDIGAADIADQAGSASGCPALHPWLTEPQSWKCDLPDGTVCSWPAEGCEPGQKPDNVCTCVEYGGDLRFECERPFHNCLPLEGSDVPEGTLTRPIPNHREVAETCESTLEPRQDPTCIPSRPRNADPENECASDADCEGEGARCLDEWQGMGATLCTCHVPECFEDSDCPGTGVCSCGKTENSGSMHCEGPGGQSCLHECLLSDCQTDADCGEGKFCTASWDICGWQKVGYHCHDPEVAECFSAWECMGEYNWGCNFEKGTGWVCQERPMCD